MDQDITVIIIMLSYNQARYVRAAIEGVLNQTLSGWELIIIDGGSRDNTEVVIEKYLNNPKIKLVKQSDNFGISKNRNTALAMARGEYIAILDSDDVWIDQEKLEKQVRFLEKKADVVLVGTQFERIDENGRTLAKVRVPTSDSDIRNNLLSRNVFCHSSAMFRKSAAEGGYDENLAVWEDYDLWLRLGQIGKLANLNDFTTAYRMFTSSISKKKKLRGAYLVIKIVSRYKKSYPHFYFAYLKSWLRILVRLFPFYF